jgi:hypothetical protein
MAAKSKMAESIDFAPNQSIFIRFRHVNAFWKRLATVFQGKLKKKDFSR